MAGMAGRDARLERALAGWRVGEARLISELRSARLGAGLSRRDVGAVVGVSQDRIGRFERHQLDDVGLGFIWRYAAGVGLVPSLRLFPGTDPVRDAGQLRLLGRLRVRLPPGVTFRTEVPLVGRPDQRAWDAVIETPACRVAVEAETRLTDLQAVTRRITLKHRDDATIGHVIILVGDTRANRLALAAGRDLLRADFPLDTRAAMTHLSTGRCPGASAVVIL
jgi:transcriptional regulator with XRE-family HTH domain